MMILLKRIMYVIVIILVLLFICASVYIHFYGKALIEITLTNALKRHVTIDKISYRFPLGLKAQNLHIAQSLEGGNFFDAKDVIALLSPEAAFRGQLIFDSVTFINPMAVIEKINDRKDSLDEPERRYGVVIPREQTDSDLTAEKDQVNNNSEVVIKLLVLKRGRFQYKNTSIDKDFSVALEDVYLKCEHLIFPAISGRTDFKGSGRLVKKGNPLSGSSVEGMGWVDIVNRDMKATVEVVEADGSVGMSAEAVSKNNEMEVTGEVKFQNLLMGAKKEDSSDASAVNDLISSALSSAGVEIGAKFSFKTKMDDFRPEQVSFSGNVVTK